MLSISFLNKTQARAQQSMDKVVAPFQESVQQSQEEEVEPGHKEEEGSEASYTSGDFLYIHFQCGVVTGHCVSQVEKVFGDCLQVSFLWAVG